MTSQSDGPRLTDDHRNQLLDNLPRGINPAAGIHALVLLLGTDPIEYLDVNTPRDGGPSRILAMTHSRVIVIDLDLDDADVPPTRMKVVAASSRPLRNVRALKLLATSAAGTGWDVEPFGRWQLVFDDTTVELPIDDADNTRARQAATRAVAPFLNGS